jgi:hypothetical protein
MNVRHGLTLLTIALSAPLAACSSDDGTSDPTTPDNEWGLAAAPCNIESGYAGDEACIMPPPKDMGMQFHYGPRDYTKAEMDKWLIRPGEEVTDCILIDTPNETDIYFAEYHARMRPGSHHMLLYVIDGADLPDSDEPQLNCREGLNQRNLFGAQEPYTDVKRPSDAQENDGLAVQLKAKQQGIMQLHFYNTTKDQVMLKEAWANLIYADPATVTQLGDPIFFIGGVGANVQLNQTEIFKGRADVPSTATPDFRLVIGTGHFHAHTSRFTAWTVIDGVRELLMEDYDFKDPALIRFDSTTKNTMPEPDSVRAGGRNGPVYLKPGDAIEWECEVTNNDKPAGLQFGNQVYDAEMCNMFGMYAPTIGGAWSALGEL